MSITLFLLTLIYQVPGFHEPVIIQADGVDIDVGYIADPFTVIGKHGAGWQRGGHDAGSGVKERQRPDALLRLMHRRYESTGCGFQQ